MREKPHFLSFAASSQIGPSSTAQNCSRISPIVIQFDRLTENERPASAPVLFERIACDSPPDWRLAGRAGGTHPASVMRLKIIARAASSLFERSRAEAGWVITPAGSGIGALSPSSPGAIPQRRVFAEQD